MDAPLTAQEQMDIVVVGHVDHGKSTVIGRLMADTGSLPQGKLEAVKAQCQANARPFEYAFLLDALKNEQAQGITIDAARCFFQTESRRYIIHDAPGHIEFLKNMVTGAARAQAALLVIDADEGIQENSKRHGYILSLLGIQQIVVLVNKMDLPDYSQSVFDQIESEYRDFLQHLGVTPVRFIPISAREGENIATRSEAMPWYGGPTVLGQVDDFEKVDSGAGRTFRMPVQDIYKFTDAGDDRRIVAGTIETGSVRVGDDVVFHPSGKRSTVASVERFNVPVGETAAAGEAVGLTLATQIYIKPGELMARVDQDAPQVGTRFRSTIFWMGHAPMIQDKRYKLKVGAARVPVQLVSIASVLDASELSSVQGKQQLDRHDVGECIFETTRPVAYDLSGDLEPTSRFVIVDNFEIAGCGIVLAPESQNESLLADAVEQRERDWDKGYLTSGERAAQLNHTGKTVIFVGDGEAGTHALAKKLELRLFLEHVHTYYLSPSNLRNLSGKEADRLSEMEWEEHLRNLGRTARLMTDAGLVFITSLQDIDGYDLERLRLLNEPNEVFVVQVGPAGLGEFVPNLILEANPNVGDAIKRIVRDLNTKGVLPEYQI